MYFTEKQSRNRIRSSSSVESRAGSSIVPSRFVSYGKKLQGTVRNFARPGTPGIPVPGLCETLNLYPDKPFSSRNRITRGAYNGTHTRGVTPTRTRQKYLGDRGLIALIAVLSAFVPLSTDLYLPALPGMSDFFHVSVDLTNLTLILFFIFFTRDALLGAVKRQVRPPAGPDHRTCPLHRRKRCMRRIVGHLAPDLLPHSPGRRRSAASAVATAMVKDVYNGRKRESVLALVQSMVVISPAVARCWARSCSLYLVAGPLLGALPHRHHLDGRLPPF